ncbi:hypothetical protein AB1484_06230 [Parafrankia sp. FMc6]|uniref:hypothetical protein n=1 Tax=Parafrankia soli TaxID=2599596 RepID=UPI0034D4B491
MPVAHADELGRPLAQTLVADATAPSCCWAQPPALPSGAAAGGPGSPAARASPRLALVLFGLAVAAGTETGYTQSVAVRPSQGSRNPERGKT